LNRSACGLLGTLAAAVALLAVAAPAGAIPIPGENGRIVLTSARSTDNANLAELFLLPVPFLPGGPLSSPIASSGTEQHRHPTWSPDRTKIAYARGVPPDWDIYVKDVTNLASTPVNLTNTANVGEDRPAWSPDGTKIAYESEVDAVPIQRDVLYVSPNGGTPVNFTNTLVAGEFEGKPAWSPDSQTIYYENGNSQAAGATDIFRKSISGGVGTLAVFNSGVKEIQPSISPNGDKICYSQGNGFDNTLDVRVAPLATAATVPGVVVSKDPAIGEYNCAWSPDNTLVAYVHGTFTSGRLVALKADGTDQIETELAQDAGANSFDGNPDWAPDGRPDCPDATAEAKTGVATPITLTCEDTGPQYERSEVKEFPTGAEAQNGTVEFITAGDPVIYTSNPQFIGEDSFEFGSFDAFGFGSDRGKVTVKVTSDATCKGQPVTIVGTAGDDTIPGTTGADVVHGLDGNDTINGGNGKDILCGGLGNDRINGGKGKDQLIGNKGKDRLNGGKSKDKCTGGPQKDRLRACESGK
jgi:Tol biopolymer transport system component